APVAHSLAPRFAEGLLHWRAVFEDDHVPAEGLKQRLIARPQALADHRIEALAVVIDDPPAIAQALLPALEDGLEDVAFVELGVADQRDHAAFGSLQPPAMRPHIILNQPREQRLRDAESHRARREVDVVYILAARGIALRALIAAKILELLPGLPVEQILDRVIDRACVRLDCDAVLRAQHAEIKRGHDGCERGGGGLVSADLHAVDVLTQVVSVMDGPAREPQHLFLELVQYRELARAGVHLAAFGHGRSIIAPCGEAKSPA